MDPSLPLLMLLYLRFFFAECLGSGFAWPRRAAEADPTGTGIEFPRPEYR